VPQKHLKGRVLRYTQAKVIGGGSSINAQLYTRGNALDYEDWRQMGCPGWGYEDVLPYFRKSEVNDSFENRFHGKTGPLGVSQPRAPLPICEAYFAAAAEVGIGRVAHRARGRIDDGHRAVGAIGDRRDRAAGVLEAVVGQQGAGHGRVFRRGRRVSGDVAG